MPMTPMMAMAMEEHRMPTTTSFRTSLLYWVQMPEIRKASITTRFIGEFTEYRGDAHQDRRDGPAEDHHFEAVD